MGAPPRRVARTGGLSQSRTLIAAGSRPFSDLAGWRRTGRPRSSGWPTCATGGGVPRRRARSTRPTRAETVGAEGGARARLADHGSSRSCAPGGGACILRRRRRALRTRASGRRPAPPAVLGRGLTLVPKRGAPNRTSAIRAAHDRSDQPMQTVRCTLQCEREPRSIGFPLVVRIALLAPARPRRGL